MKGWAGTRSCVLVLSGVIRKSLNGSGVLVNHGGLHRLDSDYGRTQEEVKRKKALGGWSSPVEAGKGGRPLRRM